MKTIIDSLKNRWYVFAAIVTAYLIVPGVANAKITKNCPDNAGTDDVEGLIGLAWGYGDAWGKVIVGGAIISLIFVVWFNRTRHLVIIGIGALLVLLLASEAFIGIANTLGEC